MITPEQNPEWSAGGDFLRHRLSWLIAAVLSCINLLRTATNPAR